MFRLKGCSAAAIRSTLKIRRITAKHIQSRSRTATMVDPRLFSSPVLAFTPPSCLFSYFFLTAFPSPHSLPFSGFLCLFPLLPLAARFNAIKSSVKISFLIRRRHLLFPLWFSSRSFLVPGSLPFTLCHAFRLLSKLSPFSFSQGAHARRKIKPPLAGF